MVLKESLVSCMFLSNCMNAYWPTILCLSLLLPAFRLVDFKCDFGANFVVPYSELRTYICALSSLIDRTSCFLLDLRNSATISKAGPVSLLLRAGTSNVYSGFSYKGPINLGSLTCNDPFSPTTISTTSFVQLVNRICAFWYADLGLQR